MWHIPKEAASAWWPLLTCSALLHISKEAGSAEAVNARQGITGRLDSGVNGIIGVQVLLKKRKLDQPKKKCPYSLMTLPLFWMT